MKNFLLYFPGLKNIHLTKDVGLIPFIMKKYYNYNSSILSDKKDDEFKDAKTYLEDLNIEFIDDVNTLDEKLKKTDILMLMGIYNYSISIIDKYKTLNPNGIIYLKTDMNIHWLNRIEITDSLKSTLEKCDLISVESFKLCEIMNKRWPVKIEHLPNGYYNFSKQNKLVDYSVKENTILSVGRCGFYDKGTEILLNAFSIISDMIPNWKLKLVGAFEEWFKEYTNNIINSNPLLKDRIEIIEFIDNKETLKEIFEKAKIYCLPSRSESMPHVYAEAAINGCYIITSNIESSYDITDFGRLGSTFEINNTYELAKLLVEISNKDDIIKNVCEEIQLYAKNNLNLIDICAKLDRLLKTKELCR